MEKFAKIISIVFHPVFSVFYAISILLFLPSESILNNENTLYNLSLQTKKTVLVFYGVFTVFFPLSTLTSLFISKSISSFEIKARKERFLPLVLVTIIYILFYYYQKTGYYPTLLLSSCLGIIIAFIITLICNIKSKISLHGLGMGLILGLLISYYHHQEKFSIIPFLIISFVIGLVGWSRIKLKSHTNFEYFMGTFIGAITQIISINFKFLI